MRPPERPTVSAWVKANALRILVHAGALWPLARMAWSYAFGLYLVDPVRQITTYTGRVALHLLVLSLACTPLATVFGFKRALRARRPLGLYAFFYALLHALAYVGWDYRFDLPLLWRSLAEQRFVVVGLLAFLILLALALTSIPAWQRRLGKAWRWVQRAVYVANLLVIVHFLWLRKEPREPLIYGGVVLALLILRLPPVVRASKKLRSRVQAKSERAATD